MQVLDLAGPPRPQPRFDAGAVGTAADGVREAPRCRESRWTDYKRVGLVDASPGAARGDITQPAVVRSADAAAHGRERFHFWYTVVPKVVVNPAGNASLKQSMPHAVLFWFAHCQSPSTPHTTGPV